MYISAMEKKNNNSDFDLLHCRLDGEDIYSIGLFQSFHASLLIPGWADAYGIVRVHPP
jgi:hypothetical protein